MYGVMIGNFLYFNFLSFLFCIISLTVGRIHSFVQDCPKLVIAHIYFYLQLKYTLVYFIDGSAGKILKMARGICLGVILASTINWTRDVFGFNTNLIKTHIFLL